MNTENSPEIKKFIREYRELFWYTPEAEKVNICDELLVETILNYGDMKAVRKLLAIMGHADAAAVFFSAKGRKVYNYYPEIYNFFTLYFNNHVQRNPE
ncbi:MAG: hypothetical protein JW973_10400 [Bacteroidales bacterium]|nr:hypothetical protein [Bacteroidales bacterium]